MRLKKLGNTGLLVSELCLGTMTFGTGDGLWRSIGKLEQPAVDEIVRQPSTMASTLSTPRMSIMGAVLRS